MASTNQVDTLFVNEQLSSCLKDEYIGDIGGFGGQMSSHLKGEHIRGIGGLGVAHASQVETQCRLEYVLDT